MSTTHADRWPFDPNIPHTPGQYPCYCHTCRTRIAAAAKRTSRRDRRDMERWMVDPQILKDRKR